MDCTELYECVAGLYRTNPKSLPWIHPIPHAPGYFLLTEMRSTIAQKYSGQELVIFDRDHAVYYWMPGAGPDATGDVPLGNYRVLTPIPGVNPSVELELEKSRPDGFTLIYAGPDRSGTPQEILPRTVPPHYMENELHEIILLGLQDLERSDNGASGSTRAGASSDLLERCGHISFQLNQAVARLLPDH